MLKKELILPGVVVKVNDKIKYGAGVIGASGETKNSLSLYTLLPGGMSGGTVEVFSGEELTIIKKPRRTDGINLCRVRVNSSGIEGEVYWTELRSSSTMIKST